MRRRLSAVLLSINTRKSCPPDRLWTGGLLRFLTPRPLALALLCAALAASTITAQILTSQVDNARTGANTHETVLTPANVNAKQFGRIFTLLVDGEVYAQPLFVPSLMFDGKGIFNTLFVATEEDSVYAYDADGSSREPLWHKSFVNPGSTPKTVPPEAVHCPFIQPSIGITSTPVIDLPSQTLYVLARTMEGDPANPHFFQRLHALDLTTGKERPGSPVEIQAPGFDPLTALSRAGLLLTGNQVVITWGSSCDVEPYHGWVMAYDKTTLKQTAAFNTSPDAGKAGIWQSDNAPAADDQGNIFTATGNGKFTAASGGHDYGDTMLKLAIEHARGGAGGIAVLDYFTPAEQESMDAHDQDLGSGGPMLLPDQPGPHRHLALIGDKSDIFFVLDRDLLGGYEGRDNHPAVEKIHVAGGIYAAPAYWNGHVYLLPSDDYLADYPIEQGRLREQPAVRGSQKFLNPGATPSISANGNRDGIVWVLETKVWDSFNNKTAVLHAYDAANIARELYNSEQNSSRDRAGSAMRFTIPTVANGHVYVPAKGEIDVYSILGYGK